MIWVLLLFQQDPVGAGLRYLARHQSEDGSWGKPPASCTCPRQEPDIPRDLRVDDATRRRIAGLIERFQERDIQAREEAQRELVRIGPAAIPQLRAAGGDEETLVRCRAVLDEFARVREGADLGLTGLALLAFLGAGYSHLSKHTVDRLCYGDVVKNGVKWIIARQERDPLEARILAAFALSEAYGLTGSNLIKEPAQKAIAEIEGDDPEDSRAMIFKGMALKSAEISGLELQHPGALKEIADAIAKRDDRLANAGATLLHIFAYRSKEGLEARAFPDPAKLSDEELFLAGMSHFQQSGPGNPWREWYRGVQAHYATGQDRKKDSCDRGSWKAKTRPEQLRITCYNTLAQEFYFR